MNSVLEHIAEVPDFPKKGILFYDITPMLANPQAYKKAVDALADEIAKTAPDAIISPEARGFFFGIPVAMKLGIPFIPVRKRGKLPRETLEVEYELEYGTDVLCIHNEDIKPNARIAIVDDILATGGTAKAMCKMLEIKKAEVACCAFFMELEFLNGRDNLSNTKIISIIKK